MLQLVRRYKMSDGSLMAVCMRILVGATRDVAVLANFGWTAVRLAALSTAREAFANLPSDIELSGMMAEATAAKNLVRKNATEHCSKEIMLRVSLAFGEGSPTYRQFKPEELYSSTDTNFWLVLKRIHRVATRKLTDLSAHGLTAAHLATLDTYITAMNDALQAQIEAIEDRDHAVQVRIEAGNAIYEEMVKLGEVGKRQWLNVDESKYNEYVLYPHSGGVEPQADQQVFESEVATETVLNLSVTNLDGAETISAENTSTVDLYVYFASLPTDLPPIDAGILLAGQTRSGTIADARYVAGVREYLNVYNASADTVGSIAITVTG